MMHVINYYNKPREIIKICRTFTETLKWLVENCEIIAHQDNKEFPCKSIDDLAFDCTFFYNGIRIEVDAY